MMLRHTRLDVLEESHLLEQIRRSGAKVFRNDEDGDVIVTIKDQEAKVAVTKP